MKPLKLTMCAFGPFASETIIDFKSVAENGIFLISGNTGAGKTTIFDAVSFALYGCASGDGRDAKSIRSDFAKKDCETYVELEFLHKGSKYKVYRKPEQLREKKRGGGVTVSPAEAVFTRPDGTAAVRYKEVTAEITELLGMDYVQFKQIVMIAQGEFRKLLIADSGARAEIFRKLFNTDDLKKLQERLSVRSWTARQKCEELKNSIDQYILGIKFDDENEYSEPLKEILQEYSALNIDSVLELLEYFNSKEKEIFESVSREYERADALYTKLSGEFLTAQKDNRDIEVYRAFAEKLVQKESEKAAIDAESGKVNASRTAIYNVRPFEEKRIFAKEQVSRYEKDRENLKNEEAVCEVRLSDAENRLQEVMENAHKADMLSARINSIEADMGKYEEIEQLRNNKGILEKELSDIQSRIDSLFGLRQSLETELESLNTNIIQKYSGIDVKLAEAKNEKNIIEQNISSLHELSEKADMLIEMCGQLEDIKLDYVKSQNNYQSALDEYKAKDKIYYDSQAGILAAKLEEDMPCPVCGSISHPKPAKLSSEAVTKEELEEAERKKEKLRESRDKCVGALKELEVKEISERRAFYKEIDKKTELLDRISSQARAFLDTKLYEGKAVDIYKEVQEDINMNALDAGIELDRHNAQINMLQLKIIELQKALDRVEIIKNELNDINFQREELNNNLRNKSNVKSETVSALELLQSQIEFSSENEAGKQLKKFKAEKEAISNQLERARLEVNAAAAELSATKALLSKNGADMQNATNNYETAAESYREAVLSGGFNNEVEYRSFLVSKEELEKKDNRISEWFDEYKKLKNDNESYAERTKGLVYKNLDEIERRRDIVLTERSESGECMNRINMCLCNNLELYSLLKNKSEEFCKAQKEFEVSQLLSKTANGELQGKEKLKFEQYVQGVYFKQVLEEANKRLNKMSSGQYTMIKRDEALDGRRTSGLEIDVMDHYTGKVRGAGSLSGGESFKAALALALGLSDVIQSSNGGIDVDVMFIDEGFGSLDQDSLELAVNVLQELSAGNRLIGIISHVSELKERIERQIVIEKTNAGSHLEIVVNR